MLELLVPAGSPEAVTAAVQNGADAVYISLNELSFCRSTVNFSDSAFEAAVRYCRVRGCRVYFALNIPVFEHELQKAAGFALRAQRAGADAVIVRDLGVAALLRKLLPDMDLYADYHLNFTTPEGAELAAALGFKRVFLPPEIPLEEAKAMVGHGTEIAVFGQTPICAAVSGTCRMSAFSAHESADRGLCSEVCREQYSFGGRRDDRPMSFRDRTLLRDIPFLKDAGVDCLCLGSRDRRNEYAAAYAALFRQAIDKNRIPSDAELDELEQAFVPYGTAKKGIYESTDGYREPNRRSEDLCTRLRKEYSEGEERRVGVEFAVLAEGADVPIRLAALDAEGHRAVIDGPVPRPDGDMELTKSALSESMYRTAGTPFHCVGAESRVEGDLRVSALELDMARRSLLYALSEERAKVPDRREENFPDLPKTAPHPETPGAVFAFRSAEQMTQEMAALQPQLVYAPIDVLDTHPECADLFAALGAEIVCALPAAVSGEKEADELRGMLARMKERGIRSALTGNLELALLAAREGMRLRGDIDLAVTNACSLGALASIGFSSATVSPELTLQQIRDLPKPMDTEMVVYGRIPVMVSVPCLLKASAGRCTCTVPGQMADTHGGVWPVTKHFGCRNTVWSSTKIWLGDMARDWVNAGLWAGRLNFSTESPRECLEVANSYLCGTGYRPNGMTRGRYIRGVR